MHTLARRCLSSLPHPFSPVAIFLLFLLIASSTATATAATTSSPTTAHSSSTPLTTADASPTTTTTATSETATAATTAAMNDNNNESVFRFAFGSCNKHTKPQPFWEFIQKQRHPRVFAWLGDIIYADKAVVGRWRIPGDIAILEEYFAIQRSLPGYSEFANAVPIIGVWDDHDYGKNDGDKSFNIGQHQSQYLWNFLDEPVDSPRRQQSGVWSSHVYDASGRTVRIILLDNRSHLDTFVSSFTHSKAQDMLGDDQWQWLEEELSTRKTDITIIGSGVQILADDKQVAEGFYRFPGSQAKLLSLVAKTNTSHAMFISGDVHLAEINTMTCADFPFPLYDFTSSGLTHAWKSMVHKFATMLLVTGTRRVGPIHLDLNFGEIDIVWNDNSTTEDGTITMRIFGPDMQVHLEHTIAIRDLSWRQGATVSDDVAACAGARLDAGMPVSCRRVLDGCSGGSYIHFIIAKIGILLVIFIILSMVTSVLSLSLHAYLQRDQPGHRIRFLIPAISVIIIANIVLSF